MEIKKFVKDHKKELIIGGLVIAGVATAVYVVKTKKAPPAVPAPTGEDFHAIVNTMLNNWDEVGVTQMITGAAHVENLGEIGQHLIANNNASPDDVIQFVIAHIPDMSVIPAA